MILVAGSPAPVETYTWPPLARQIYELKRASPYVFDYTSVRHLQFEMLLRAEIIRAAEALNASGVEFATFEFARTNERYWQLTPRGGFLLRAGVRPADAIRDIYRSGPLYAFECATAIPILYYKAVLEVLGDETFNRLFQDLLLYSWNYDSDLGLIQEEVDVDRAFPGDVLYFDNPDYHPRSPEWQGVNVVMLGDDLFYGHGAGITSGGDIIRGLNMRRRPFSFRSAYLMDLIVYPDFLYLSRFMPTTDAGASTAAGSGSVAAAPFGSTPGLGGGTWTPSTPIGMGSGSSIPPAWIDSSSPSSGSVPPPLLASQHLSPSSMRPPSTGAMNPSSSSWASHTPPGDVRPSAAQQIPDSTPPWLSLPPISMGEGSSRIRARVGRRRSIC